MLSLAEVRERGFELLCEHLGVSDALRFIGQYELGHGDYTKERRDLFGKRTVKEIAQEIRKYKAAQVRSMR
ncbi:MAG: hypothetical protein A3F84_29325 [Candidatus Handelsmanbacteria bacterium RIFCSPLOWO2_12_FULL_64_10]|uniref:Uncharacterized protein n=1 Tax=Handelsmanbacteria sp. (strain RIFCSPLOWO2_12_FULL_64_10) TaxID=1817868 RepID=A0A1F6D2F1_HANXR|nr:MAG: hypothetical protein A3F84_29325 [Candidatus Handelsmanbacteria bacterium RIFCSPLOWO2_12_FULL_64_10]